MPIALANQNNVAGPTYGTTRQTIRQEAAKILGFYVANGVTTAATATSITSTGNGGLRSSLRGLEMFKGCYLLMTSGPEAGNFRRISDDNSLSGVETVDEPWVTGPTATGGDTFEIYAALSPTEWGECIDIGLTRCMYLTKSPITLVTDGDMEAPNTTAWTGVNANLSKSVSDAVTSGAQSLLVTNIAANGYAQSSAVPAVPGQGYVAFGDFRCIGTTLSTATLQAWDLTNNQLIYGTNVSGADPVPGVNFAGGMIQFGFVTPTNCWQFAMRLTGAETTATIAWDDIIVNNTQTTRVTAPSWIKNRNQIDSVLHRVGANPRSYVWPEVGWPLNPEEDPTAVVAFRFDVPNGSQSQALFAYGERAYGPMASTADSATTACPLEWAKYVAAKVAYEKYGVAIEMANTGREKQDKTEVEKMVVGLNKLYMPFKESRVGFKRPWPGEDYSRPLGR